MLDKLRESVISKKFQWIGVKRVEIPKPGKAEKRPLGIPAIQDRIVQEVLRSILDPIFDANFKNSSHGFRMERSPKTALKTINTHFKTCKWYIEGDMGLWP